MPKLEIIFTPEPFKIKEGPIIEPKPVKINQLQNYYTIEGTYLSIYASCPENNDELARALQKNIEEIFQQKNDLEKAINLLKNSTK